MRAATTTLLVTKVRQMDEELQYLRAFFNYMALEDKFYRKHEFFNENYDDVIPKRYNTGD